MPAAKKNLVPAGLRQHFTTRGTGAVGGLLKFPLYGYTVHRRHEQ